MCKDLTALILFPVIDLSECIDLSDLPFVFLESKLVYQIIGPSQCFFLEKKVPAPITDHTQMSDY